MKNVRQAVKIITGKAKNIRLVIRGGRVGETKRRCIVGDGLLKGLGGKPFSRKVFMLNQIAETMKG